MSEVRAIISGCHSGPNPAPGLGIARSLRVAYPNIVLVAKDHTTQSSGVHADVFDERWIARAWDEIDLQTHRDHILQRLSSGDTYYFPGSDLEVRWLAREPHPRVLSPASAAIEGTAKPLVDAARLLDVSVPPFLSMTAGSREIHTFGVANDWDLWAKGPVLDARRVRNWLQAEWAIESLPTLWGEQPFFLQRHVQGTDVCLAFAAFEGRLLGTAWMEKQLVTQEGKCWSAGVSECPRAIHESLAALVARCHWTGGGELEFVRDEHGTLWLIDWNQRFPAWIHGATLTGVNLPARLLEAASGVARAPEREGATQFTRVVWEVPVLPDFALPPPPPPRRSPDGGLGKMAVESASGLTTLMRKLLPKEPPRAAADPRPLPRDDVYGRALLAEIPPGLHTPARVFLPEVAAAAFRLAEEAVERNTRRRARLTAAFSIKTNPDRRLLGLARDHGLLAEAISVEEVRWAMRNGFRAEETIYNGPVRFEAAGVDGRLNALFADSVEALEHYSEHGLQWARILGLRIAAFRRRSRFGVPLWEPDVFARVAAILRERLPDGAGFGVHHHLQSDVVGEDDWARYVTAAVALAEGLATASGHPVRMLDLGGGFTSEAFGPLLAERLPKVLDAIEQRLPSVEEVVIEPGKAACEGAMVLVSRVIELRERDDRREAVVDASIAELPNARYFPRHVHAVLADSAARLPAGRDRILGRICMEDDILATCIALPKSLRPGDFLAFSHAGAYEASMSYVFGKGGFDAASAR